MKDRTGRLLVDDAFQAAISNAISVDADGTYKAAVNTVLRYGDDGSIATVNKLRVNDLISGQLGYLIGSLNFLYVMIEDQLMLPYSGTKDELTECRAQVVQITVELLLNLTQVQSIKNIDSIIDQTTIQKAAIKRKAGLWPA